jgi:hypothetical protein
MAGTSDEDRLIKILELHRDLKRWVIKQLADQSVQCRETYGNDAKGDILIIDRENSFVAQERIREIHFQFNSEDADRQSGKLYVDEPHIEIKTQYLYGEEVEEIIQYGTVVGIVSAGRISQPGKRKLSLAGIVYAENIPITEFQNSAEG